MPALAAEGRCRRVIVASLDICGALTGAAWVLSAVIMAAMIRERPDKAFWASMALATAVVGIAIALVPRLRPARIVIGAITATALAVCFVAAIIMGPIH